MRHRSAPLRRHATGLLLACLLPVFAGAATAATYRWQDADGKLHYSDRPPVDVDAERLAPLPPPPLQIDAPDAAAASPAPGAPGSAAQQADEARRKQELEAYEALVKANCEKSRNNLERLQAGKLAVPGDGGKLRRATPAEERQIAREARGYIAQNCR